VKENLSYIPLKTAIQPVEHLTGVQDVTGSNPAGSMIFSFFHTFCTNFFAIQLLTHRILAFKARIDAEF